MTNRACVAPGEAKEDWAIIRALSSVLGHCLPFDSLHSLRLSLIRDYPHFGIMDEIMPGKADDIISLGQEASSVTTCSFTSPVKDFYLTNPIARASAIMAECSSLARNRLAMEVG